MLYAVWKSHRNHEIMSFPLHRIYQEIQEGLFMKKMNSVLSGKLYAVRRQYPAFAQFEKGITAVKKELNKDQPKK